MGPNYYLLNLTVPSLTGTPQADPINFSGDSSDLTAAAMSTLVVYHYNTKEEEEFYMLRPVNMRAWVCEKHPWQRTKP